MRSPWATAVAGLVLVVGLVISIAAGVAIGAVRVPLGTVIDVVLSRVDIGVAGPTLLDDQIVWQLRMPRVLAAAATGAGLAVVGAVLQSLTQNALADPYILGVSGGASVGAVAVLVLGVSVAGFVGPAAVTAGAFAGSALALLLVFILATGRSGALASNRMILAGVAIGQICASITSFLVIVKGDSDAARRVLTWTLGSLAGVRWTTALVLVAAASVTVLVVMSVARSLDTFAFGEVAAASLGSAVTTLRWSLLVGTALVTAVLVASTGVIGFVGLVVPHVVRLLSGPMHRRLIPLSALLGAILLVWSDTAARTLVTGRELPIGLVTAILGAPVFALLLKRQAMAR